MFRPFEKTGDIFGDLPGLLEAFEALADPDSIATLANLAALLNWYLEDVNWVGFYLWSPEDGELVLGPFQGLPACLRIMRGRGVCGVAAENRKTRIVDDVREFPGHIACDESSRSELVVPIEYNGEFLGVLDIDSPVPGRFLKEEAEAMEILCARLAAGLSS